jgi:hypothetical protein
VNIQISMVGLSWGQWTLEDLEEGRHGEDHARKNTANTRSYPGSGCWGSVQITKIYVLRNPELPKDLSISNAITVGVLDTYLEDRNAGITLPHKH